MVHLCSLSKLIHLSDLQSNAQRVDFWIINTQPPSEIWNYHFPKLGRSLSLLFIPRGIGELTEIHTTPTLPTSQSQAWGSHSETPIPLYHCPCLTFTPRVHRPHYSKPHNLQTPGTSLPQIPSKAWLLGKLGNVWEVN